MRAPSALAFSALTICGLIGAAALLGPAHGAPFGRTEVSLNFPEAKRGSIVEVAVNVTVRKRPIQHRGAKVWLRCTEEVEIDSYQIPDKKDDKGNVLEKGKTISIKQTSVIFPEKEFTVAPGGELAGGTTHTLNGSVQLPANAPASFKGKYSRVKWEANAGLEMGFGSPSSGWREIDIQ